MLLPITCKYSSSMKMREAHSPQLACYGSFATTSNSIASAISTSLPAPTSKFSTAALCKDAMTSCETRIKSTPNVVGMWTNHDSSQAGAKTRSGRRACSFQKMPSINLVCQLCYVYVDVSEARMHRTDKQFVNFRNRSCSLKTIIKQIWTRTKDTMRP